MRGKRSATSRSYRRLRPGSSSGGGPSAMNSRSAASSASSRTPSPLVERALRWSDESVPPQRLWFGSIYRLGSLESALLDDCDLCFVETEALCVHLEVAE